MSLTYNIRNVFVRWRATLATIFGVAMLVLVYVCLQSMAAGLEKASSDTGDPRNVMILRKGSIDESSSQIMREQFQRLKYSPEIARDPKGRPFISADVLTILSLSRLDGTGDATVSVRGMTPGGMKLRPQVRLGSRPVVCARPWRGRHEHEGGAALRPLRCWWHLESPGTRIARSWVI